MDGADIFNAALEFFGGCFVLLSVRRLWVDKSVKGVSPWHVMFFCGWGYWNLFYYPSLGQWWSTAATVWIATINTVWCVMLFRYWGRCD